MSLNKSRTQGEQIQQIVIDYFKETDNAVICEFISSFVYHQHNPSSKISKLIEKFIADQGIVDAYLAYLQVIHDESKPESEQPIFRKASSSQIHIIEQLKTALLNLSFNRFNQSVDKNVKEGKKELKEARKDARSMANEVVTILTRLNDNENYFYGKEDDEKAIEKAEKILSK